MPKLKAICILFPISFLLHTSQRHASSWHLCVSLPVHVFYARTTHPPYTHKHMVFHIVEIFTDSILLNILCTSWLNSHNFFFFFEISPCWGVLGLNFHSLYTDSLYSQPVSWHLNALSISDNLQIYISVSDTLLNTTLIHTIAYLASPFEHAISFSNLNSIRNFYGPFKFTLPSVFPIFINGDAIRPFFRSNTIESWWWLSLNSLFFTNYILIFRSRCLQRSFPGLKTKPSVFQYCPAPSLLVNKVIFSKHVWSHHLSSSCSNIWPLLPQLILCRSPCSRHTMDSFLVIF